MSTCCNYVPLTVCPGQPAGAPALYLSTRQLRRLGHEVGDAVQFWVRYKTNGGTWCYSLNMATVAGVCRLPAGGRHVSLGHSGISIHTDCGCEDPVPGEGPGPDPDEEPETFEGYWATPCLPAPLWASPIFVSVHKDVPPGTYTRRWGGWCYTVTVTGSPAEHSQKPSVWLTLADKNLVACADCRKGSPAEVCGNQELPPGFAWPYVMAGHEPAAEMIWEDTTGVILRWVPGTPQVTVPESGRWVTPRDEYESCAEATAGYLATLCPEQPKGADITKAVKLWIRRIHGPDARVVDDRSGLRYVIDPAAADVPRPWDAIVWHARGDFPACGPCLPRSGLRGVRWLVCPREPRKKRAKALWTLEALLPGEIYHHAVNHIAYSLPLGPVDDIPLGVAIIPPINDADSCQQVIDDNAHGGGGGNAGGGDDGDPNEDDDPDNDEPDDNDDPNCQGCGGGGGGGTGGGGPGGPGGGGGGGPGGNGTPTSSACRENPVACFNRLQDCEDPANFLNATVPNVPRGWAVKISGHCWKVVAIAPPDSLPLPADQTTYPYAKVDPATVEGYFPTCELCSSGPKHCYHTWELDCETMAITLYSYSCGTSDPPNLNVWNSPLSNKRQITTRGPVCIVGSDCATNGTPPPFPADSPPGCPDCADCPEYWTDVFGSFDCFTNEAGWKIGCKSKLRLQWNAANAGAESGTTLADHMAANGVPFPLVGDALLDMTGAGPGYIDFAKTITYQGHTFSVSASVDTVGVITASVIKTTGMYAALHWVQGVGWDFPLQPIEGISNGDAFAGESDHGVWAVIDTFNLYYPDGTDVMAHIYNFECCED